MIITAGSVASLQGHESHASKSVTLVPAGTYNCGTCHCEPGYLGARCECQEGEASSMYLIACREAEGKQICSGRGECSCNQCLCYESEFGKIYGSFCECDDFSCARHKGILCSGRNVIRRLAVSPLKLSCVSELCCQDVAALVARWWLELQLSSDRTSLGIELNENTSSHQTRGKLF